MKADTVIIVSDEPYVFYLSAGDYLMKHAENTVSAFHQQDIGI